MSSIIGTNAIKVDGRTLRSERTHKRIIDAVIQLVEEGNPHLRTAEIAERAEVSVRSIFQHFPDRPAAGCGRLVFGSVGEKRGYSLGESRAMTPMAK